MVPSRLAASSVPCLDALQDLLLIFMQALHGGFEGAGSVHGQQPA